MRLINADKLKQSIINEMLKAEINSPVYSTFERVIADIDEQPTAYDIDKVVNLLEKTSIEGLGINKALFRMDEEEYSSYCSLSLHDAKEIVKSGLKRH